MADGFTTNVIHHIHTNDTDNLYGVLRNQAGQCRDVVAGAWDNYASADMGDYDISIGTPSGRLWKGSFPDQYSIDDDYYVYQIWLRVGASPVGDDDVCIAAVKGYWDGTRFLDANYSGIVQTQLLALKLDMLVVAPEDDDVYTDSILAKIAAGGDWSTFTPATDSLKTIKAEAVAIKAKTDNLPADPADDSDIDTQLAALAAFIDTEIADIKAKTDNLPASPANETTLTTMHKLIRADKVIDVAKNPWVTDYKEEGTESKLMSKTMKNTAGENITNRNNVLGQLEQE